MSVPSVPGATGPLSVGDVGRLVRALVDPVADLWVHGEIAEIRSRGRYLRLTLIDDPDERWTAKLPAVAIDPPRGSGPFQRRLRAHGLELAQGLRVAVHGHLEFFAPFGELRLVLDDIDPTHTLGSLSLRADALRRELAAAGLLTANRAAFPDPALPLRVGLVTARGSDAHRDVRARLADSGYPFDLVVADATVQGPAAPASVAAALERLAVLHLRAPFDVVAVSRGGGGAFDLAAFDSAEIAHAVAHAPFPVYSAVGHDADRHVIDDVAHTSLPTPTALALTLIDTVRRTDDELTEAHGALAEQAARALQQAQGALEATEQRLAAAARGHTEGIGNDIAGLAGALAAAAMATHRSARSRLTAATDALREVHPPPALGHGRQTVADAGAALARSAQAALSAAQARLAEQQALLSGYDVDAALARGFSISRVQGRAVRHIADVTVGQTLRTELRDGWLDSSVTAVTARPVPAAPEGAETGIMPAPPAGPSASDDPGPPGPPRRPAP